MEGVHPPRAVCVNHHLQTWCHQCHLKATSAHSAAAVPRAVNMTVAVAPNHLRDAPPSQCHTYQVTSYDQHSLVVLKLQMNTAMRHHLLSVVTTTTRTFQIWRTVTTSTFKYLQWTWNGIHPTVPSEYRTGWELVVVSLWYHYPIPLLWVTLQCVQMNCNRHMTI